MERERKLLFDHLKCYFGWVFYSKVWHRGVIARPAFVLQTLPCSSVHGCADIPLGDVMLFQMHEAIRSAQEFVDQSGNHFLCLGAFPSLFLSVALGIFNLREARWEPSGGSVTHL